MTASHADIVRQIVELATRAPSINNSQPWRWRITKGGLDLYADWSRQLPATDPVGRNLVISCGTALHHAEVAAAALGWATEVRRLPGGPTSMLLARIRLHRAEVSETAESDLWAIEQRCTDRRRFTSWPVPDERLAHLAQEAERHGTHAVPLLDVTARFRAEMLVGEATERQSTDERVVSEQRIWVDHSSFDGIPVDVLPAATGALAGVRVQRSANHALKERDREIQGSDGLIALYGATDDPPAWLAAGEGLSALWLTATAQDLSVVPLSQVIEVEETRRGLAEQVLGGLANPHLLVRIGWQAISRSQLPRTSRRPVDEVLGLE